MGEGASMDKGSELMAGAGSQDPTGWQDLAPGVMVRGGDHASTALPAAGRAAPDPGGGVGMPRQGGRRDRRQLPVLVLLGILGVLGTLGVLAVGWVTGAVPGAAAPSSSPLPLVSSADPPDQGVELPRSQAPMTSPEPPDATAAATGAEPSDAVSSPRASGALTGSAVPPDLLDPSGAGEDWWSILGALDARRQQALTERDPAALSDYLVPGSPAWRADSGLIAELRTQGLRPVGLATRLVAIEGVEVAGAASGAVDGSASGEGGAAPSERAGPATDHATVVLVDQRSAYTLVDPGGVVVQAMDGTGMQRWVVTLARAADSPPQRSPSGDPPNADEQQDSDGLFDTQVEPEGGDSGWRIVEVSPAP